MNDVVNDDLEQFKRLCDTGFELIKDLVYCEDRMRLQPDDAATERLREAVAVFSQALEISSQHWQCWFMMGKALEGLGEYEKCLDALLRAHNLAPSMLVIGVEAGGVALRSGQYEVGVRIMETVSRHHPDDPRLPGNLGLSYLFLGDIENAREALERAAELEPQREQNRQLLELVEEVACGTHPCPRNVAELAKAFAR